MGQTYYREPDNSNALGWGLAILAVVILLAAVLFVFAGNRGGDVDMTTIETSAPMEIDPDNPPNIIEQPVVQEVPVPVPVEPTIIREREVQVPAPSQDAASPSGTVDEPVDEPVGTAP